MTTIPNSQLNIIKQILHDKYICHDNLLVAKEPNHKKTTIIMQRKILSYNNLPFILFRYDPNQIDFFPYFSNTAGLKRICDYILFFEEGKLLYCFLIELKYGKESATQQLEATECFFNFIHSSAKRLQIHINETIQLVKIRISESRAKKRNRLTKPIPLMKDQNGIINYDYGAVFRIKDIIELV